MPFCVILAWCFGQPLDLNFNGEQPTQKGKCSVANGRSHWFMFEVLVEVDGWWLRMHVCGTAVTAAAQQPGHIRNVVPSIPTKMNVITVQRLTAVLAAAVLAAAVLAAAAAAAAAEFEALVLFISVLLAALMVQVS
jgi:hypothetical protein